MHDFMSNADFLRSNDYNIMIIWCLMMRWKEFIQELLHSDKRYEDVKITVCQDNIMLFIIIFKYNQAFMCMHVEWWCS